MARNITVWNPWRMLPRDPFNWDLDWDWADQEGSEMDIYEEGDNVVVRLRAPGFDKDDIEIQIEANVITLRGRVNEESEEENKDRKYYRREIRTMSFSRSAELPTMVQADKAKAMFKNGVLTVTLPKSEEAKPKSIDIEVE